MVNKVILIGNVGADPEVRTLENGSKVARVRLATTERFFSRQSQDVREHTEWHSVTFWSNLADIADRFVRKGSQIYVSGRIRSRDWMDDAGNKRYAIEIIADELKLLGRRSDHPASGDGSGGAEGQGYASGQGYTSGQNYGTSPQGIPASGGSGTGGSSPAGAAGGAASVASGGGAVGGAASGGSGAENAAGMTDGNLVPGGSGAAAIPSQSAAPAMPDEDPDDLPF